MEAITKISIAGVSEGYDYKDSPDYRPEFGYWVTLKYGDKPVYRREWRKTYATLRADIFKHYVILLPEYKNLGFANYGAPYNSAIV